MKLLRSFPLLAYSAVLVSIVGFCVAGRSAGLLLVAGVLAALSWYVTEGPRGRALPGWTANILVLAVTLNAIVDLATHRGDPLGALGRFMVWLALIKLYQHKRSRDYAQLLSLSLVLMLIGCLQSTDLLFGGALLLYGAIGLYALLLFRLYAASERMRAARLALVPAGYRLVPSLAPIAGRRSALHLRGLAVAVGAAGLIASAFLFVLFPRDVGRAMFGGLGTPGERRSGFTDEIDLIGGTRITDSSKVVLRIALPEGRAFDEPLRLRGAVLDRYEGEGRWTTASPRPVRTFETQPPGFTALSPHDESGTVTQEIDAYAPMTALFSVYVPVSVATSRPRALRRDILGQTIQDAGEGRLRHYTIRAQPEPPQTVLDSLATGDGAAAWIPQALVDRFSSFDPRVRRLAAQRLDAEGLAAPPADAPGRFAWNAAAAGVLSRFLQSGAFTYTTDLRDVRLPDGDGPPADPIVHFLFDTRRGHCEYFASALAAMCNSIGIPARLVSGFVALEFDDGARAYVVRESNAHAWVEVLAGPHRWAAFDPTPPATLRTLHGTAHAPSGLWRQLLDRFEARWTSWVVGFDGHTQAELMRSLDAGWSRRLGGALDATRRWAAAVNRAFYFGPAGYIWMGIVGLAVVVAGIAVAKVLRRRAALRSALHLHGAHTHDSRQMVRQLGFYLDMLAALERAGSPKPAWQPPLQHAAVLARRDPQRALLVRRIGRLFYAARYGGRSLSKEEIERANSMVEELRRAAGDGRHASPRE